jgi:hypothetical protein
VSEENEERKAQWERLTYALFKALNEFNNAMDNYKENNGKSQEEYVGNDLWNLVAKTIQKYNFSLDGIVEALPSTYKPIAKVMMRMPVNQLIDIASNISKDYEKDENVNYRSLEETLMRIAGKRFFKKIFSD